LSSTSTQVRFYNTALGQAQAIFNPNQYRSCVTTLNIPLIAVAVCQESQCRLFFLPCFFHELHYSPTYPTDECATQLELITVFGRNLKANLSWT